MTQPSFAQSNTSSLLPVIVNDSSMFIGSHVDSLTEQERYFNPIYLIVQQGKEYLKQQLIRGSVCDCDTTIPNRTIGVFSVSQDRQVTFSQGNLQYFPAANLWKFANTQYESLGNSNKYISPTYRNWVDLFAFSTDYTEEFLDWGTKWICGDKPGTWRTLSADEWEYLLKKRPNATYLHGIAQVADKNGIILLPDDWVDMSNIPFKPGFYTKQVNDYSVFQSFTIEQWLLLENAGAVFLPAAGIRNGTNVENYETSGYYWSNSIDNDITSYRMCFNSHFLGEKEVHNRNSGLSVRLVADIGNINCDTVVKVLSLSITDTTLFIGESLQITTIPHYCINGPIEWSLSDSTLARITDLSANGCQLTVLNADTLFLTATATNYADVLAKCRIIIRSKNISGVFSVSGDKHVIFSPGNLQHLPASNLWKFADTQYDCLESTNTSISLACDNWVDLFGWSANNSTAPLGISTSTNIADYAGDFVDWGTNSISGETPNKWRTLTKDEWEYLLDKRTNAKKLRYPAKIDDINGFILLPDNWICPEDINFAVGTNNYDQQSLTTEQWTKLEQTGAIFLPAAGRRQGEELVSFNEHGNYWSSSLRDNHYADYLAFTLNTIYVDALLNICLGRSVRLVYDTVIPEYVDLGLSVKWATFNIGAKSPDQYGYHFAWGETMPKNKYSWTNYKWCNGAYNNLTKYCTNSDYGTIDNQIILEADDDAASIHWKDRWRTPTDEEWTELRTECDWHWITLNGVKGYRVTSKIAGYTDKSIFIPAAGTGGSSTYTGKTGYYWSSSLYPGDPNEAWRLHISSTSKSHAHSTTRYSGYSIRPVYGNRKITTPIIETITATQITSTSALVGGKVTTDGGSHITEYGVVYGTSQEPTISDYKITANRGIGLFFCDLLNLQNHTTYYARAFATNEQGTAYGEEICFTTGSFNPIDISGTENGYAYVDLALPSGILWATCNIGSTTPEGSGDYFAWGEIEPKDQYTWKTYKWSNGNDSTFYKYNTDSSRGIVDNITTLSPADDAATVNWGGNWRMPTYSELSELRTDTLCTWVWTTLNGVKGHRITSKRNGNSIFLPAAGCISNKAVSNANYTGYYNSSSLIPHYSNDSRYLVFRSSYYSSGEVVRSHGLPIRPVLGKHLVTNPSVTTYAATLITENTALVEGRVTNDGGANIVEHGVVYSTSKSKLTLAKGSKVISNDGLVLFSCTLTGLLEDTTYYVRTYATNEAGNTSYGSRIEFKTISTVLSEPSGNENGYEYVDLGLSVKWATCNIGATTPEKFGDYFAWGETTSKADYRWDTYKWCNIADTTLTKYCVSNKYGIVDNTITLDPTDDAATILWKGKWRMPTDEEWAELRTECTWYWTTKNYINGYKIVGKNGNSIFLPAAGYQLNEDSNEKKTSGYYSSASLYVDLSQYAHSIFFNAKLIDKYYNGRFCGQSVRPVYDEEASTYFPHITVSINDTTSINMMYVEGSTFTMGANNDAHQVTLSDFYIGETEVTQGLWKAVMNKDVPDGQEYYGDEYPVAEITLEDCRRFVDRIRSLTGFHFRIPTEAEWEYAAKGGKYSKGYIYSGSDSIEEVAWYKGNTIDYHPLPVKQLKPNELGIYDMSGNLAELVSDWYDDYNIYHQINPTGGSTYPIGRNKLIHRGGCWTYSKGQCQPTYRHPFPNRGANGIGLRLVLSDKEPFRTVYVNDTTRFYLRSVEGGTFMMGAADDDLIVNQNLAAKGDELPQHQVTLDSYYIAETEVTQELWEAVMGTDIYDLQAALIKPDQTPAFVGKDYPMYYVYTQDMMEFTRRLSQMTGLNFRLPTEAEWEFAARGGNLSNGYLYAGSNDVDSVAWYNGTGMQPVAQKMPNELGIYDLSGNVLERCVDYLEYHQPYQSGDVINPRGYIRQGGNRAYRGGAYSMHKDSMRVTHRAPQTPTYTSQNVGARLVMNDNHHFQTFKVGGVWFDMIFVRGGTFQMGIATEASPSEHSVYEVTLSDYYIGQIEVTQALWKAVMGTNPSSVQINSYPVTNVTYPDCQVFVQKLSQITGYRFRLPTEAEWEYAARGGQKSKGYEYAGSNNINEVAWYGGNSGKTVHEFASKLPNELGIYDMSGNVWEWCQDWYGAYPNTTQTNPQGPTTGSDRVLRSGSYITEAAYRCSTTYRQSRAEDYPDTHIGLRLVLETK